jgi:hypothetical protein
MSELNSSSVTAPSPAILSTMVSAAAADPFLRPRPSDRARTLFAFACPRCAPGAAGEPRRGARHCVGEAVCPPVEGDWAACCLHAACALMER